ncbi:hypothetical protein J1605_016693 [Eschrichtius robustus]|uniref:Uncharacterized protein n=1 Tax=Eschrichtius robustus TaxID=9764 RepID=A0AB34I1F4_ESCRO|nr:hypothetical protein J1605_016693 [Eschrichtius robustus]
MAVQGLLLGLGFYPELQLPKSFLWAYPKRKKRDGLAESVLIPSPTLFPCPAPFPSIQPNREPGGSTEQWQPEEKASTTCGSPLWTACE